MYNLIIIDYKILFKSINIWKITCYFSVYIDQVSECIKVHNVCIAEIKFPFWKAWVSWYLGQTLLSLPSQRYVHLQPCTETHLNKSIDILIDLQVKK